MRQTYNNSIIKKKDRTISNTSSTEDKRIPYHVLVSFNAPQQGTILIAAENEEHCRALVQEAFKDVENLQIHDIYPANAVDYGAQPANDNEAPPSPEEAALKRKLN